MGRINKIMCAEQFHLYPPLYLVGRLSGCVIYCVHFIFSVRVILNSSRELFHYFPASVFHANFIVLLEGRGE